MRNFIIPTDELIFFRGIETTIRLDMHQHVQTVTCRGVRDAGNWGTGFMNVNLGLIAGYYTKKQKVMLETVDVLEAKTSGLPI